MKMTRKILQAGPATLAISLPMSWVKKFSLKKGQELAVEEQGNALKIITKNILEEESATLDVGKLEPIATKIIGMLYKAGYKKINAFYTPNKMILHRLKQQNELEMIKHTFGHLTGMQFWELGKKEGRHYASVIESAKVNPQEFDNVFSKLCLHLLHQAEQILEALSQQKPIFDEAFLAEQLINQTHDFCIRILITHGHDDYRKVPFYYDFIIKLESIGDQYFRIACNAKEKIDKDTLYALKQSRDFISQALPLIRKFDFERITSLTQEISQAIKTYEKTITAHKIKTSLVSYAVYSLLLEIYELIEILYALHHDYFRDKG